MSFLKVGAEPVKTRRLYLTTFTHSSGLTTTKFGVASGTSSVDRGFQQLRDYFMKTRETPIWKLIRDQKVPSDKVYEYETLLKRFFSDYRYENPRMKKFDGLSEHHVIPLEDAIQAYEAVISGLVPDCKYVIPKCLIDSGEDDLPF